MMAGGSEGRTVIEIDKNQSTFPSIEMKRHCTKSVVQGSEAQSEQWPTRSFCRKVEAIELVSDCW